MRLTILIIIYSAIEALGLWLLYGPLRRAVDPARKHAARAVIPTALIGILYAFPMIGAVVPDGPVCWFFQKYGDIQVGYILYFFGMLLLVRIVEGIARARRKRKTGEKQPLSVFYCRSMLAVLAAGAIALNVGGFRVSHDIKTTFYELPKETLGQTEPLRIVLIGDTHIGVNSTPKLYEDMAARINEQHPDLVLLAGDIVTSSYGAMRTPDLYVEIFRSIEAPKGRYVIYGNHDVEEPLLGGFTYVGAENTYRHPEMEGFIESWGWTLLKDEVVRLPGLNGLVITGRRDESRPGDGVLERASLAGLLQGVDPAEPILLLQHEPSDLKALSSHGIDLAVSGHTHDGQIFPGNVFCRIKGPQSYGLKYWKDAAVVVTSGVGTYGPPIRVGTISEIVVIDLK